MPQMESLIPCGHEERPSRSAPQREEERDVADPGHRKPPGYGKGLKRGQPRSPASRGSQRQAQPEPRFGAATSPIFHGPVT